MPESSTKAIPQGLRTKLKPPPAKTKKKKKTPHGLLSVIMPVYNVETYLVEAVQSVLTQSYRKLELILVDDGSTDSSGQMCETIAATDKRVRVIHKSNAGLGAARNTGTLAARGEFLTYVDSDDIILKDAYQRMVSSLRKSGSDFVTGNVLRQKGSHRWQAWNQSRSHTKNQSGVTLHDNLDLIFDTVAWNKVFRRKFWMDAVAVFPEAKLYEDMVPIFTGFLKAKKVDVLKLPVYAWRQRDEGDSITQRRMEKQNLADKFEMISTIENLIVDSEYRPDLLDLFYLKTLDGDLWAYVPHIKFADDDFLELLQSAVQKFWARTPANVRALLPYERRVQYQLMFEQRGAEVPIIREWFDEHRHALPTIVEGGRVSVDRAKLPAIPSATEAELYFVDPELKVVVTDTLWTEADELAVHGYAYIPFVTKGDHTIEVVATSSRTGAEVVFETVRKETSEAAIWASDLSDDHLNDDFVATIDPLKLSQFEDYGQIPEDTWEISVRVNCRGVAAEQSAEKVWRGGAASVISARLFPDDLRAVPVTSPGKPLAIQLTRNGLRASRTILCGTKVTVEFDKSARRAPETVWFGNDDRKMKVQAAAQETPDGLQYVAYLPVFPELLWTTWYAKAIVAGRQQPVIADPTRVSNESPGEEGFALETNRPGQLIVTGRSRTALVQTLEFTTQSTLRLAGDLYALSSFEVGISRSSSEPTKWVQASTGFNTFSVDIPLLTEDWYDIERSLRNGTYSISIRQTDHLNLHSPAELLISNQAAIDLPLHNENSMYRAQIDRAAMSRLVLKLSSPIPRSDRGKFAQSQIVSEYDEFSDVEPEESVFFYSYLGVSADDSALAIQRELQKRGTSLTMYWGVDDFSVSVPPGGIPVIKGSRDWFEKVARSRYLVNNCGGIMGYAPRKHQTFLQTWHGTPFKYIGASESRRKNLNSEHFRALEDEASHWDQFISPSPYFSKLIRDDFLYEGEIIESGYPRNDVLVTATPDDVASIRTRLGISADAKVALYAPTFRERQRSGWSAPMYDGLDLERLAKRLGDEWTILVRGHNFNARHGGTKQYSSRIIDATHHHDVNDLYLASDLLITDYSSVMFDYAVTGKPIVFYVPDMDAYIASRGSYFDLAEYAPGALCTELNQIVEHLKNLPKYQQEFADRYDEFRLKFAPWDDGKATERVVDVFFS